MFLKRAAALLLLLALVLPTLAACRRTEAQGDVRFTDSLGREVALERSPRRVAALLGSFADVWLLAGGEVCAAPDDAWDELALPLGDARSIGGAHSPSLELVLASSPDLVLASASTASHLRVGEVLTAAGIPVAYFDVSNFGDYLAMLEVCTTLTARPDLYRQNGLCLSEKIEAIKASYAAVPPAERRILLLRASSGAVKAKGSRGTILGEMLADLGCINIADSEASLLEELSVEAVIRGEPRHILVVAMGDGEAAARSVAALLAEDPAWGTLGAVREGRLYTMEKRLFNLKPNARWAEAYGVLYETLTKQ